MFHWVFEPGVEERAGWTTPGDPSSGRRTIQFRSYRGGGRWHAACDLVVPVGTPIHAICDGTVLGASHFYEGTWQLTVLHEHPGFEPFTVRYGEVLAPEGGGTLAAAGARVSGGAEIARVGRLSGGGHMLHFELFASGARHPTLSIATRLNRPPETYTTEQRREILDRGWDPDFQRRSDLADPTAFLQALKAGRLPPAPTAYRGAGAPTQVVTFGDDEVETIVGRAAAVPAAVGARHHGEGAPDGRRGRPPSWWATHAGWTEDDSAVGHGPRHRRGPDY